MIRIERIRLREIHLPLKEPFQISSGVVQNRRILLVQVIDADGAEGWGECVAGEYPNYHPETIDTAWLAIREWIAPKLFEREFEHPADIFPWLQRDIRGHHMAKAGVEMSTWELAARKSGQSLSRFLGGTREKIAVGISIGIQPSLEALVQKVREAVSAGYRKAKIKIKPGADVEYVRAVREALGNGVPIMVDANNAYTLADIERLRALEEFNLMMIEQPLAWDDLLQHARLQSELRTPVCLDESITGVDRARDMIELGAGKIINIKPGRVGGFTSSKQIHDLCAENGIPVWCGGMLESGVGRAHNVALASLGNFTLPGDISPSSRYWQRDIVQPEWQMDDQGMIAVPAGRPGMGVELDMDYIEHLTVRQQELTR
ncbi:MAG: o-succinylbenzoate synthase [candidate division KSB1 bacterium]|nr:o-succinylbenzoate synthase [candidate division KSB1 bacterium]